MKDSLYRAEPMVKYPNPFYFLILGAVFVVLLLVIIL